MGGAHLVVNACMVRGGMRTAECGLRNADCGMRVTVVSPGKVTWKGGGGGRRAKGGKLDAAVKKDRP